MPGIDDIPPPGEAATIDSIVQTIMTRQKKRFKHGTTARRALHAKSLGVIEGKLIVRDLPSELRVGLFRQAETYNAVVRFSNGGLGADAPDVLPNVRGMALKVYGVAGDKVLPGEEHSTVLDFVMANYPSFFLKTIDQFDLLIKGKVLSLLLQSPGLIGTTISATAKIISSLLAIDYYSQVPHRFGDRACKYALLHAPGNILEPAGMPDIFDKDYLRHDLDRRARNLHGRFTLCVQFQQQNESIVDPTQPWHGSQVPLADLELAIIDSPIEESDGEILSFNPARVLAEHAPLAWPGRLRQAVYKADADWRKMKNNNNEPL